MDEKELNEAICNIMFWYKDTPMAIPQKIVELIIKDRKRIVHCLTGIDEKTIGKGQLLVLRRHILRLAGLDEGEREK